MASSTKYALWNAGGGGQAFDATVQAGDQDRRAPQRRNGRGACTAGSARSAARSRSAAMSSSGPNAASARCHPVPVGFVTASAEAVTP